MCPAARWFPANCTLAERNRCDCSRFALETWTIQILPARLSEYSEAGGRPTNSFLCVVNWGEVIYHALRSGGEGMAKLAEDAMRALPIQVIDANKDLTLQAAHLKASNKRSYADCFAAALAMKKKCELVTGDKEFKQAEKHIKVRWMQ